MTENKQMPVVGAIIIAGLLIAGAILLKGSERPVTNKNSNTNQVDQNPEIRPVDETDHILGNKDAEVVIVEYSDTECPFCKNFHNTMHQVVAQSNGEIAWVYRHFPIPQLHQKAEFEAHATECAAELGGNDMFWSYIDEIFKRTNSNDSLPISEIAVIAQDLGLDETKFNECVTSGKHMDKIQSDVNDARNAGVRGTPTSFIVINGKVVDEINGAQSLNGVLDQVYLNQ